MAEAIDGELNEENTKRTSMREWKCRSADLYTKINQVGEGTFGKVYKAEYKNNTSTGNTPTTTYKTVALKKILLDNEKEGFPITAIREITIMKRLHHKNILPLVEIVTSAPNEKNKYRGNVYLVFEYMEHDFSGLFKTFKPNFTVPEIKCILYQILCGIGYLHKCNIIHRDIKSANILLNNKGEVKVGDFGLARIINPDPTSAKQYTNRVVTLWYRAPELLLGDTKYGFGIDVWSIGCVFSELLTGYPLFDGMKEEEQIEKIFKKCGTPTEENWNGVTSLSKWKFMCPKTYYPNVLREHFKNNPKVDDVAFDLLNKMLSLDPKKRITVAEALKHPYFSEEHKPVMCKPEELPKMGNDSHEYQSRKEFKAKPNMNHNPNGVMVAQNDYLANANMSSAKKEFLGNKRKPE